MRAFFDGGHGTIRFVVVAIVLVVLTGIFRGASCDEHESDNRTKVGLAEASTKCNKQTMKE